MKFLELTSQEKVDFAARYVIVHSILYYEMNESVISDKKFDKKAKVLAKLVQKYPKEVRASEYYKAIKNFDGSTGFDLFSKLSRDQKEYLVKIANSVLRLYKRGK